MNLSRPTSNNVTTHLTAAMTAAATTATIEASLNIPYEDGLLQIDYDSVSSVGVDGGPETIYYDYYASATGNLTGIERAKGGTTAVAHAVSANVQAALSVEHLNNFDRIDGDRISASHTIIGDNDYRATRYVPVSPNYILNNYDPANTDWTDVSVSAQTSTNAYAVTLRVGFQSTAAGHGIWIRPNGSSISDNARIVGISEVANVQVTSTCHTGLDANRVFEYAATNAAVVALYITLTGYYEYVD